MIYLYTYLMIGAVLALYLVINKKSLFVEEGESYVESFFNSIIIAVFWPFAAYVHFSRVKPA